MTQDSDSYPSGILAKIPGWGKVVGDYAETGCQGSCFISAEHLRPAAKMLLDEEFFIEAISGVDLTEGLMIVYHFDRYDRPTRLALRVIVPHQAKNVPSIVDIFSGADWHERECFDFFGVDFEGHPNLKPLLLPDDLGFNPLIKDQGRRSLYEIWPLKRLVDSPRT
ncbi:MAG: NADH-quinone oxidoreductase subunit C [Deltaproteobacteria bacterium]|nr:NADH-quinone oxidoreductase subunit C [Deltaproteobacteria bacterium]